MLPSCTSLLDLNCEQTALDSSASCQSDEPLLSVAVTSKLQGSANPAGIEPCHISKRRRVEQRQTFPAAIEQHHARSEPDAAGAALSRLGCVDGAGAAGSAAAGLCGGLAGLGCSEAHECLDEADCSSVETAEGFVVYQSPLSLAPPEGEAARDGGVPGAPAVLAEQQPPPLAGDPDLAEMLSVLCDTETELQPNAAYLEHHGASVSPDLHLDATMRRTAVSWLVEVAAEFGLHQETLFLGIALLDRFLSSTKGVPRTQLQLVAVACMLIASKHEEEMHPSVLDFTSIADNCFMPGDLLRMEAIVLDCLSFRINTPTAHTFLSMYKQALGLQPRTCALASYLTELALLEYDLLRYSPSHVASAATLLAQVYMNDTQGICHLPSVTRFSVDELRPCLRRLLVLQRTAHSEHDYSAPCLPVRDKYRGPQWLCVGCTTPLASAAALCSALQAACGSGMLTAPGVDKVGTQGGSDGSGSGGGGGKLK